MEDEENRKQKEEEEEEQNNPMKVWLLWRFWLNEFKKGGSNKTRHLNPEEWLESNFSLQHHCWIKQYGYESEENDGSIKKKLVIVKQILLVSTIGNVYEAVWRIYILNWWCKRFWVIAWLAYQRMVHHSHRNTETKSCNLGFLQCSTKN